MHEFAHVLLGKNSLLNTNFSSNAKVDPVETVCNKVAGEIIVPKSLFIDKWIKAHKDDDLEKIIYCANYFKCSQVVIARKALDEGYIDKRTYNIVADNFAEYVKRNNGGGNYYRTLMHKLDNRFLSCLNESVNEGKTSYTYAYRLTNTSKSTYKTLVSDIGGALY